MPPDEISCPEATVTSSATEAEAGMFSLGWFANYNLGDLHLTPAGAMVFAGHAIAYVGRIDPASARIGPEGYPDGRPSAIAVGEDAVWIANGDDSSTISRIHPGTAIAVQTINVGRGPRAIAVGEGAVWVANSSDGTVSRVDPEASSSATIPVGDTPSAVAIGEGAVWVANAGDGTVSRIDPRTGEVTRTVTVGGRPEGLAVGAGAVWVAVHAPSR